MEGAVFVIEHLRLEGDVGGAVDDAHVNVGSMDSE